MVLEFVLDLLYILSLFSKKRFADWSPAARISAAYVSIRQRVSAAYGSIRQRVAGWSPAALMSAAYVSVREQNSFSRKDLQKLSENSFREEDVYKLPQNHQPHLYHRACCTNDRRLAHFL